MECGYGGFVENIGWPHKSREDGCIQWDEFTCEWVDGSINNSVENITIVFIMDLLYENENKIFKKCEHFLI